MNKHTKLVMSLLFIILIILAAAVTKFYLSVPDETDNGNNQSQIVKKLEIDSNGNRVFEDESGHFGIVDIKDRIIVSPEWIELDFTNSDMCIASKRIGSRLLSGCIDYEGNTVIPFIYRNITRHDISGFTFYSADSDSDGSCVIYSDDFTPYFNRSWEKCSVYDNEITLESNFGSYMYTISENGFIFKSASLSGNVMDCDYVLDIYSRVILSKINTTMLEDMLSITEKYLQFAYTDDNTFISDVLNAENKNNFHSLFEDSNEIIQKKLVDISEIYVYSKKSDSDIPHYAVTVTAKTEISYKDDDEQIHTFTDEYKTDIEFSGSSSNNLSVVSGKFRISSPEYPQEDEESIQENKKYNKNEDEIRVNV